MGGYLTTVMDENPSRHSDSIDPYAILIITTHGEYDVFDEDGIARNVPNSKFDNLSKIDAAPIGDINCLLAKTANAIVTHIGDQNYLYGKVPVPFGDLIAPGMLPLQLQLLDPTLHFDDSTGNVHNPNGKYKPYLYDKFSTETLPDKTYTINGSELTDTNDEISHNYDNDFVLIIGGRVESLRYLCLEYKIYGVRKETYCITLSELLNQVYSQLKILENFGVPKTTINQLCIVDLSCSRLRNGDEGITTRGLRGLIREKKKRTVHGGKKRRRVTRINKKNKKTKKNKKNKKSTKHKRIE